MEVNQGSQSRFFLHKQITQIVTGTYRLAMNKQGTNSKSTNSESKKRPKIKIEMFRY